MKVLKISKIDWKKIQRKVSNFSCFAHQTLFLEPTAGGLSDLVHFTTFLKSTAKT